MPQNEQEPQKSEQDTSKGNDYAKELQAVQAEVAAEIAANAKQAKANQLTEADLDAIKF